MNLELAGKKANRPPHQNNLLKAILLPQIGIPSLGVSGPSSALAWHVNFQLGNVVEDRPPPAALTEIKKIFETTSDRIVAVEQAANLEWVQNFLACTRGSSGPNFLRWAILYFTQEAKGNDRLTISRLDKIVSSRLPQLNELDFRSIITHQIAARNILRDLLSQSQHDQERAQTLARRIEDLKKDEALTTSRMEGNPRHRQHIMFGTHGLRDFMAYDRPLPSEVVYVIVKELIYPQELLPIDPNDSPTSGTDVAAMHLASSVFFGVSPSSRISFNRAAIGTYFLYRPSLHAPGKIVKAKLTVSFIGQRGEDSPLQLLEEHLYSREIFSHANTRTDGELSTTDGAFAERFTGIMFKKAGLPIMISIRATGLGPNDGAANKGAPRFTMIQQTNYMDDGRRIASMSGITLATFAGGGVQAVPVCIERVNDAERFNRSHPGVYARTNPEIPEDVISRLGTGPTLNAMHGLNQ